MKKTTRRILSFVICVIMLFSAFPFQAFAELIDDPITGGGGIVNDWGDFTPDVGSALDEWQDYFSDEQDQESPTDLDADIVVDGDDLVFVDDVVPEAAEEPSTLGQSGNGLLIPEEGLALGNPMARASSGTLAWHYYPEYSGRFGTYKGVHYNQWYAFTINGQIVYCLEFFNLQSTDGGLYIENATVQLWENLTTAQQKNLGYAAYFGYGGAAGGAVADHIATQVIVWSIVERCYDSEFNLINSGIYDAFVVDSATRSAYESIISKMKQVAVIPSFAASSEPAAQTYGMDGSSLQLTDTNNVLGNYNFTGSGGLSVSNSGNTLTVTGTPSGVVTFSATNSLTSGSSGQSNFLYTGTNNLGSPEQIKWRSSGVDPVDAYFKVGAEAAPPDVGEADTYILRIMKYSSGTQQGLAGAKFRVVHHGHGTVTEDAVTDNSGKFEMEVPWDGTYEVWETDPPLGYMPDPDNHRTVYIDKDNPIGTVTFFNDPYTSVLVKKIDSITGEPLAGAEIKLYSIEKGITQSGTTNSSGLVEFTNLEPGSYYVQEVKSPDRYVLNDTVYPVELISNEVASVTIPNEPYTGIEVEKVDANTGQRLGGALIRLKRINGGEEWTQTTNDDGIAYFGLIEPGDYYVEELQAPFGYILNDTRFPVTLISGDLVTVTVKNYRKDGLFIKKVDKDGQPIAGAVFELRRQNGQVIMRETTDENGLIYRGYLTTDTYVAEEIQPPYGYLMDENNPQSIFIDSTDDNKEFILTFTNPKRPSIEIMKVDADTNQPLPGAKFRISEQGGSKTYDVTTGSDGKALLEHLEIDVTYIVEELTPPPGYTNSNYKEAIVLEPNRVHTITVSNKRIPDLTILKKDKSTGELLFGATFRISWANGSEYRDVTTDINGKAVITGLPAGWYSILELRAPDGYLIAENLPPFEMVAGEDKVIEIFDEKKPNLTIKKIDSVTKEPLSYAEFKITQKTESGETLIGNYTSDRNGLITLKDIEPGRYQILEVKAPDGYVIDTQSKEITIEYNQDYVMEFSNTPKSPLIIQKIDADTGEPLRGARFTVSTMNGEFVGTVTSGPNGYATIPYCEPGWFRVEEVMAPDGYVIMDTPQNIRVYEGVPATVTFTNRKRPGLQIVKIDSETGEALAGAKFTVSRTSGEFVGEYTSDRYGMAYLNDLEPGGYSILEVQAPSGYVIDSSSRSVELKPNETLRLEFTNSRKPGIHIQKIDSVTGEPLAGARFSIATTDGTHIGDYTTDRYGTAYLEGLTPGSYSILEVQAPDGYLVDAAQRIVTLKANQTLKLEFTNSLKPGIEISKIDSDTGEALPGAVFSISKADGTIVGEFTSDRYGKVYINDLDPGAFIINEVRAPSGFVIDKASRTVELRANETLRLEFTNSKLPGIHIFKVDASTGEPLANAKFRVTTTSGEIVGEFTSDRYGMAYIEAIEPGGYIITEVFSPDGYLIDSTPTVIQVEPGKNYSIEVTNTKKPTLQLLKLDKDTGAVLPGAKFRITTLDGTFVGEYTSDLLGLVTIPNLEPGGFVITEILAPEGYILDMTPKTIMLNADTVFQVEMYNTAKPGLQIKKLDKETLLPVAGVVFNIVFMENGSKKDLGSFTTGENGLIFIPDLVPGTYILTEIKQAEGYLLDPTPITIYVEGGKTNYVEVFNTPLADLRIIKLDSESLEPLQGAVFKLYDSKRLEIGTYTTTELGEIYKGSLDAGTYYLQEVQAPPGFLLDTSVRQIELYGGKTTTITIKNTPLGTLRIVKIDAKTREPLYGASFLLYDNKDNLLGEYQTDQNGLIVFGRALQPGKFKIKEIRSPNGYVLDDKIRTVTVSAGSTTEIVIENEPESGNIQIVKVSSADNELSGNKKGDGIQGAVFEIFDERLDIVDRITTDKNGIATSKDLPLGKYVLKEVEAPKYFLTNGEPIYAEVKLHGDLIRLKVENEPEEIEVTITKRGNVEAMAGDVITYNFSDIANRSNTELQEFFWSDTLPTDAIRIQSLNTGTWSARLKYDVWVRSNLKGWKKIESNLSTNVDYTIDMRSSALGFASNEYVTQFKLEFGTVPADFHCVSEPFANVRVNNGLPLGYRFVNKTDVGGRSGNEWAYCRDSWITYVYVPNRKLPKTGF